MKSIYFVLLILPLTVIWGQTDSTKIPSFEFTFSIGTTSAGPASGFEKVMHQYGFDQTSSGFLGTTKHPFSKTGFGEIGTPWMITSSIKINETFFVGLSFSYSPIGMTSGYRLDENKHTFIYFRYYLTEIATMPTLRVGILNLSLGPTLFVTKTNVENYMCDRNDKIYHLGLIADASLQFPASSTIFGFLRFRIRIMSKDKLGPYDIHGIGSTITNTVQSFEVNYSSVYFGAGIGIRL